MSLSASDAFALREYFDHLVKVRSLDAEEWKPRLERITRTYDDYQEAAVYLSFTLPVPQQRIVPPGLLEVAREVVSGVTGLAGLQRKPNPEPYLAGGAAIALQGGRRPVNDLDFNILARPGLTSFAEGDGAIILKRLNDTVLPRLKGNREAEAELRRRLGGSRTVETTYAPFAVLGRPVTIGTRSWFGVEVSLTIIEPDIARLAPRVQSPHGITLLDLRDLFSDKLKTAISRRKSGENSLKKVSQDLFDALLVAELLANRDGVDPDLSQQVLLAELIRRVPGYSHNNLEQVPLHGLAETEVAERMLDRLVRTAQAHVVEGERRKRMTSLAQGYALDILEQVEALSRLEVDPTALPNEPQDLAEWFATWNAGPCYTPPKAAEPTTYPLDRPFPAGAFVPDILAAWPPVDKLEISGGTLRLDNAAHQILAVLCRIDGGFRVLVDSRDEEQVFCAFRLTPRAFYNAFKVLEKAGYVEGGEKGVTVTDKGRIAYQQAVAKAPTVLTVPRQAPVTAADLTEEALDRVLLVFRARLAVAEGLLNQLREDGGPEEATTT